MKIISAASCAILVTALLGCTQHASTAPAVDHPAIASSDTNTFGESKDAGASNAERARAANYGSDASASSGSGSTPAPK